MDLRQFGQVIRHWYGEPGAHLEGPVPPTTPVLCSGADDLLVAAGLVRKRRPVSVISRPGHVHKVIPHPATALANNGQFFATLAATLGVPLPKDATEAALWSDRARCLHQCGYRAESFECCLRALALDAHSVAVWMSLAHYFLDPEVKDLSLAAECLDNALEIDPQNDTALADKGAVEIGQENYEEGIRLCSLAAQRNPDNFFAHYYLAEAHYATAHQGPEAEELTAKRHALEYYRRAESLLGQEPGASLAAVERIAERIESCEAALLGP